MLMIAKFYKIPIWNIKRGAPNFFDNGKYVVQYENFLKKFHSAIKFN